MAKVITVGNFKGGVGKTTVSSNLAFALREMGHSVLLVDFDSQGHAARYVSGDAEIASEGTGSERLLEGDPSLRGAQTECGIDVLHGHRQLGRIDEGEYTGEDALKLRDYIAALPYDFIVIDTPPVMAFRMIASFMWADYFLIVTKPDQLSMDGTKELLQVLSGWIARKWVKPGFKLGILMNMVDRQSAAAVEQAEEARRLAPKYFLDCELTYRRELINRAYEQKVPVWKVPRIPKGVANLWRSLPVTLGLVDEEVAA